MQAHPDAFFQPYTPEWYLAHGDADHFNETFSVGRAIGDVLQPESVIDVGCGLGTMLWAVYAATHGCECFGLESSEMLRNDRVVEALAVPRGWVSGVDLRAFLRDYMLGPTDKLDSRALGRYDVAVCMEVAEHLPESCAQWLVRYLAERAPVVVWSAATPGQGGEGHINEQTVDYWEGKFHDAGLLFDPKLSHDVLWRFQGQIPHVPWYGGLRVFRHL